MSVSSTNNRWEYTGNAATTAFVYDNLILDASDLLVYVDGALKTLTTDYTVSGLGVATGGAVAFTAAPATGAKIAIVSAIPCKQPTALAAISTLASAMLEGAFDRLTRLVQQLLAKLGRAVVLDDGDTSAPAMTLPPLADLKGKMLAFDATTGAPVASSQTLATIEAGAAAAGASAASAATSAASAATNAASAASSASAAAANAAAISLPLPVSAGGTGAATASAGLANLGIVLGTAANNVPQLDGSGRLPAIDGSLLTNLAASTTPIVAGEALAIRDLVYQDIFNQRGLGADRWYKVDTDAIGPVCIGPRLGIALAAIAVANSGAAQVRQGRVAGFSGLTAGQPVFASTTAGGITQTAPPIPATAAQNASRLIGYAASATEIDFDPDDDTVFTARNSAVAVDGTMTVQHWPDAGARDRAQAAYLVQATSFVTTASRATGTGANGTGWTGYSVRARVDAAQVSVSGSSVRVTLAALSSGTTFSNVFIGHGVTTGNLWEFAAAPTRVTFGGANSAVVGGNASLQSDSITFALDETKPLIVAMDIGSTSAWNLAVGSAPTGWNAWTKVGGTGEAGTTAPTGYTNDLLVGLASVEVLASARDEPLTIGGSIANSTATDRVNVRYDDGTSPAGTNANTHTTFTNRTNATRDMAAEVVL